MALKILLIVLSLFMASPVWATTQTMSACTQAAFNTAYAAASNNDTIAFPAGTCGITWSGTTSIAKTGLVILGSTATTITYAATVFQTSAETANGLRISNIIFTNTGLTEGAGNPALYFGYTGSDPRVGIKNVRVDNCTFDLGACYDCNAAGFDGEITGVMDHNTFNKGPDHASIVSVFGSNRSASTFPFTLGDANAVFFEDNTVNNSDAQGVSHFIASRIGSRYVIRYNTFNWQQSSWDTLDAHDQYEGITDRGSFTWEVYNNKFNDTSAGAERVMHFRGGQGVVWGNYIRQNCSYCIDVDSYMIKNNQCEYPCDDMVQFSYAWGNKNNCGADMTNCATGSAINFWPDDDPAVIGISVNVDFFNSEMPDYTAYTYPHPLVTGGADETAPATAISQSDPQAISTDSLTATGISSDAVGVDSCKYRLGSAPDAGNGTACTGTTSWSCDTSGYARGSNTLYVGCADAAGNWGSDSITVNFAPAITYVDCNADGDNGTGAGTGAAVAWKTISKVNSSTFNAGDSVLFNKGCTWREQLTVPSSGSSNSPITFGAYGTGALPVINGSNLVTTWTQYSTAGGTTETSVFTDGFESNNFNSWTGTEGVGGAVDAESKKTGTYGAHYDGVDGANYKTVSDMTEGGMRGYFLVHATTFAANEKTRGPRLAAGSSAVASMWFRESGGNTYVDLIQGTGSTVEATFQISVDTWYQFTLEAKIDASVGYTLLKIDGDTKQSLINQNTGATALSRGYISVSSWASAKLDVYYDDIEIYSLADEDPVSTDIYSAACDWTTKQVWEDGTRLTYVAWNTNIATTAAAMSAGTWSLDTGNDLVYVWASDESDPDTHTMEVANKGRAIYGNHKDYITVDGLSLIKSNNQGIFNTGGQNWTIQNCDLSHNYGEGARNWGEDAATWAADNIVMTGNTVSYNGDTGLYVGNYGLNGTISNNTIHHNCWHTDFSTNAGIKIYSGPFESENPANVSGFTISGNTIYSNGDGTGTRGSGIWSDFSNSNIIRYNNVYSNIFVGIQIEKSSSCQVYYNLSYGHTSDHDGGAGRGIGLTMDDGSMQVDSNLIYNNVLYNNRENLSVYGAGSTQGISDNVFKNNILLSATEKNIFYYPQGRDSGNIFANNCLGAEPLSVQWNGDSKTTYDAWETAYGGTTASVEADPLFLSAASGNFHLQPGSPAINAGVNVSLTLDFMGITVPQGAAPDIGAHEWFGVSSFTGSLTGGGSYK